MTSVVEITASPAQQQRPGHARQAVGAAPAHAVLTLALQALLDGLLLGGEAQLEQVRFAATVTTDAGEEEFVSSRSEGFPAALAWMRTAIGRAMGIA